MAFTSSDLTAVETAITNRISGGAVKRYSTGDGRQLEYMDMEQLLKLRDRIKRELYPNKTRTKASTRYA